ncbi:MAG: type III pantothenate kinase [Clostridiales bacterium]|nr:type III pantothenate kinase [Clostridiales bacterium]
MIFAADIGNTHILVGGFEDKKILFTELLTTNITATDIEYGSLIEKVLTVNGHSLSSVTGAVISSVVPAVTATVSNAVERFTHVKPLIVGPGVKTGLKIKIDNPAQLGPDLVVSAVAGIKEYPVPQINIYMGTATAFSLIDKDKTFRGTSIGAGVGVSADALSKNTSQLPEVALETPHKVIGTNTVDSIKSGIMYQNAAKVDGMIDRIEEEYGSECTVIATGRYAPSIIPLCRHKIVCDRYLILKGLMEVYSRNG